MAVCWECRERLLSVTRNLGTKQANRFLFNLFIAFLPAAALGLLFIQTIKYYLFHPMPVAIALIIGGLLILWAERRVHVIEIESVDDMDWNHALKVGCAQCLALIPGTSRSGATIIGGLFFGLSRKAAAEFFIFSCYSRDVCCYFTMSTGARNFCILMILECLRWGQWRPLSVRCLRYVG